MTVKECYERAVSFLPEVPEDNTDMQKHMVAWCNALLGDTINYENIWRRVNKLPELDTPPKVKTQTDEIPYNEKMVAGAFPYGMAQFVFRENDDISSSREFYNRYVTALAEMTPLEYTEITDFYR